MDLSAVKALNEIKASLGWRVVYAWVGDDPCGDGALPPWSGVRCSQQGDYRVVTELWVFFYSELTLVSLCAWVMFLVIAWENRKKKRNFCRKEKKTFKYLSLVQELSNSCINKIPSSVSMKQILLLGLHSCSINHKCQYPSVSNKWWEHVSIKRLAQLIKNILLWWEFCVYAATTKTCFHAFNCILGI